MLEFEIIEKLQINTKLIDLLKDFDYKINNGYIKHILYTNLNIIIPTKYIVKSPYNLTILEYKVNEINNKPFYVLEHNQKYSLKEIEKILKKL